MQEDGEFAEALDHLRRGHAVGAKDPAWRRPSAAWVRDAECLVELEKRLPAVLGGDVTLTKAAELVDFADVCRHKKHYAVAARLYREGFSLQPQFAAAHRYRAVCAAVLAAGGQGSARRPAQRTGPGWLEAAGP